MVPVANIITGITFVFIFHMCSISFIISLYFQTFSDSVLITFLSQGIAASIDKQVIINIIIIISFMQDIYFYIPETNYVPREYSVAANFILLVASLRT